ncbi:hypothetical protein [Rhizobium sp. C4]|uniref:hypothetical protein n=1 Tax=Rhizobium sp. C4 TaxID=1349800 RepID=UPI001E4EF534|nr:hypothetical protein [Rhizobium sp. C4]MCD2173564.1 hypothetical protein [Rhizobium sp. C4]
MIMRIYRLFPVADPEDPNWAVSPCQGEVVVRAKSRSDARTVATTAEADFQGKSVKKGEGTLTTGAAAFLNESLYTVIEDMTGRYPNEGPRAILSGSPALGVILPLVAPDQ